MFYTKYETLRRFEERGYRIVAYVPSDMRDPLHFIVKAYKKEKLVRKMAVPMLCVPRFGVDVEDQKTLEEKTDELLKELP